MAASTLLTVSTASAVTFEHDRGTKSQPSGGYVRCISNDRGQGCFMPGGDWIYLLDTKKDGLSAVVVWRIVEGPSQHTVREGAVWNTAGSKNGGQWRYKNKNFPEGRNIDFQVCAGSWRFKNIQSSTCSAYKRMRT
ncbi:hypothetical protein ACFQ2B_36595 [Streptomyces stramineus]